MASFFLYRTETHHKRINTFSRSLGTIQINTYIPAMEKSLFNPLGIRNAHNRNNARAVHVHIFASADKLPICAAFHILTSAAVRWGGQIYYTIICIYIYKTGH